jgi:hypothetical protein
MWVCNCGGDYWNLLIKNCFGDSPANSWINWGTMAKLQMCHLGYHSWTGLEPRTSWFQTLHISHYTMWGLLIFLAASLSIHICLHQQLGLLPCHLGQSHSNHCKMTAAAVHVSVHVNFELLQIKQHTERPPGENELLSLTRHLICYLSLCTQNVGNGTFRGCKNEFLEVYHS